MNKAINWKSDLEESFEMWKEKVDPMNLRLLRTGGRFE